MRYADISRGGVFCYLSGVTELQQYDKSTGITFGTIDIGDGLQNKNGFYSLRFEVGERNIHYKADVRWTTSPLPKPPPGVNATAPAQAKQEQKPAVQAESPLPKPPPRANATAPAQAESPLPKPLPGANATAQAQAALQAQQIEAQRAEQARQEQLRQQQAQAEQQRQQEMQQRIQKQQELAQQQNERERLAAQQSDAQFQQALRNRDAQVVQQVQREKAEQARQNQLNREQQLRQQRQQAGAVLGLVNMLSSAQEQGAQERAAREQAVQERAAKEQARRDQAAQEQVAQEQAVQEMKEGKTVAAVAEVIWQENERWTQASDLAEEADRKYPEFGFSLFIYSSPEQVRADIKKAKKQMAARKQAEREKTKQGQMDHRISPNLGKVEITPSTAQAASTVARNQENYRQIKILGSYSLVPDKRTRSIGDPDKIKAAGRITIISDTEGVLSANGYFRFYEYWKNDDDMGHSGWHQATGIISGIRPNNDSTGFILLGTFTLIGFDRTMVLRQRTELEMDDYSSIGQISVNIPHVFPNGAEVAVPMMKFMKK